MDQEQGNTHEVELRVVISESDTITVVERLQQQGFMDAESVLINDWYYCPNAVTDFSEIEMDDVGSYSLRVRQTTKATTETSSMNTKTITSFGDHNGWEEHETDVSNADECKKILVMIGFKNFFTLSKERRIFVYDRITFNIEKNNYGQTVAEVEIMTTPDGAESAKDEMKQLLYNLGIDASRIVPKSVTNELMRKHSSF